MKRREFLASAAAAPAIYAGFRSADPILTAAPKSPARPAAKRSAKLKTATTRARVAILAGVYKWWAPRNWRDVPAGGAIVELSEPLSFRAARQRAKWFNEGRRLHSGEWAIVVATDGRKGGAA